MRYINSQRKPVNNLYLYRIYTHSFHRLGHSSFQLSFYGHEMTIERVGMIA